MSFHSDFVTALASDVVTALSVTSGQVYEGRRPQKTPREDIEVWVEPQPTQDRARGGGNRDALHAFRVHVRVKEGQQGNLTGGNQTTTLKGHLETLRERWNGGYLSVTGLIGMQASEGSVDEDPANANLLDGYVELLVLEAA